MERRGLKANQEQQSCVEQKSLSSQHIVPGGVQTSGDVVKIFSLPTLAILGKSLITCNATIIQACFFLLLPLHSSACCWYRRQNNLQKVLITNR